MAIQAAVIDAGIFLDLLHIQSSDQIDLILAKHHQDFECMALIVLKMEGGADLTNELIPELFQVTIMTQQIIVLQAVSFFIIEIFDARGKKPEKVATLLNEKADMLDKTSKAILKSLPSK